MKKTDKAVSKYVAKIMAWYLFCPLIAVFIMALDGEAYLRYYEGILLLVALACICSEVFHKSTWWDPECIQLQEEIRLEEKEKFGQFYMRPIFIGLPAILTLLILNIPRIVSYVF